EGLADVEYQADLAAQERREKDSQRRIQEQFGDIEYNIQKAQEKEAELRRQRALAEGLADVENQADLALNQERAEIPIDPVASIQPVVAPIVDTPIVDTSLVSTTAPRIGEERLPAADPTTRPQERPAVEERKKLSDILIDPMEDFNLLPNRVGARERRIRITGRNVKIRVIGSRNGMYKVELHENGVKQPGTYFINKRWAHKTLNFTAALAAVNGLESMSEAGNAPVPECRPGEDQPVDINEIREVVAQEIVETSSDEFKPGCEVLAGNLNSALEDELQTCLMSIKRSITQGARNGSGRIDREKLFCNMYKNLRPEEQHFAGSLFTSIGEAGIIATSSQTAAPGYQEQVFVMKVLDNRLRKARADTRNNNLNALDMSLIHKQFSMYNSSIFPDFRDLFEPSGRAYRQSENKAIKAFISFQSNPGALEPADQVDNMNMYFNPHGMTRISNLRATRYKSADQRRREARNLVARLKREGKIASNYPDDRIAPGWSFGQLEPVNDLSYDGVSVRKTRPYMHQFYSNTSGRLYYGQGHDVPPSWRNQCSN
ncbi:MAG: hypothetical protein K9K67_07935, partial [Bacteriovoracaceae bacterium]|nr:hypothetical protein [Bacteriovoracaceae bacterium]